MNRVKNGIKIFSAFLMLGCIISAQAQDTSQKPVFSPTETTYDFGTIGETDGYAEHIFNFKNAGDAPLVINRIQASCGCTKPEWTQQPVEPGKDGVIIITFNPRGRIGNFHKTATVYTNEENGYKRHKLTITGVVVEKPSDPHVFFADTIGGIGITEKDLVYKSILPSATNRDILYIKNYHPETVYFTWENIPGYIFVKSPDSLKADWPGEVSVIIDGTKTAEKRGRIKDALKWTVKNREGKILGSENITVTGNYVDDFSKLSPLQNVNSPHLEIKNPQLLFDNIKGKFLGFGGTAVREFLLTNTGKSDLTLHSVGSDDHRIHLPKLAGKIIKAGESLAVKATVKAKEVDTEAINTDIYVVCNDPKGPVRMVKVTVQKAK
ncbi:MAG: DUF1573 domain-containing protein [Tannerella sp.]|jgi:hypothetical protein|nr:DUF1573 domain-containing protein [Tannerella sp.]